MGTGNDISRMGRRKHTHTQSHLLSAQLIYREYKITRAIANG